MSQQPENSKQLVQVAYDAVKELDATDEYRLAGFRIVLKSLMPGAPAVSQLPVPQTGTGGTALSKEQPTPSDWQNTIASKLNITAEQVAEIYHFTDEGIVELIIEGKDLPKTNSKSTQHIAALITGGRQAMGIERVTAIEVVRSACEHYRVYDSKNFMKYTRQLGSKFRFDGSNSSVTIELTNGAFKIAGEIATGYLENK